MWPNISSTSSATKSHLSWFKSEMKRMHVYPLHQKRVQPAADKQAGRREKLSSRTERRAEISMR